MWTIFFLLFPFLLYLVKYRFYGRGTETVLSRIKNCTSQGDCNFKTLKFFTIGMWFLREKCTICTKTFLVFYFVCWVSNESWGFHLSFQLTSPWQDIDDFQISFPAHTSLLSTRPYIQLSTGHHLDTPQTL